MKRIEEVARDRAASRTPVRRKFVEEAVDHFHQRLNVELRAEPQWTFLTAMYFSGTIFTTIGKLPLLLAGILPTQLGLPSARRQRSSFVLNQQRSLQYCLTPSNHRHPCPTFVTPLNGIITFLLAELPATVLQTL